jgi:hypothetical protein
MGQKRPTSKKWPLGEVVGAARHTWHQEPEQRPAGGTLGVLEWCSWQQAA